MSVFDRDAFANPSNEFRPLQIVHGLDRMLSDPEHLAGEEGIDQRLEQLVRAGTGGIVANVGFKEYLVSPRQWQIFRYGMQKADELGLVLWLYDEKGYPSGTAGGIVTRSHPEYVALGLACYAIEVEGPADFRFELPASCRRFVWAGATTEGNRATIDSVLALSPMVNEWGALDWKVPAGSWTIFYVADRHMYEGTHGAGNFHELKQYINVLQPEAGREFIRVTHRRYVQETPANIWDKIRAIFTDEPSFVTTYTPGIPEKFLKRIPVLDVPLFEDRPPAVPWRNDLLEQFREKRGYDLRPHLFQLFYSETEEASYVRQDYYHVITELYRDAFYVQILQWCQDHGIASSGHVLAEENIVDHVGYHGDLFAVIREMDLPGIDLLDADPQGILAGKHFMTAKQVASAAHLGNRRQIHSESSDFVQQMNDQIAPLEQRMAQGNLQYVLGINQITSYYGWEELGEENWRHYNDYMGRLASFLTGGKHVCDVAVLYPVRSVWAHFVPSSKVPASWEEKQKLLSLWVSLVSEKYADVVRHLLRHQVDLDIIDEQAVVEGDMRDGALHVADEAYRAIILPPMYALSLDTARALARFCEAGGTLLSVGPLPEIAEAADNTPALKETLSGLFGNAGPARILRLEEMPEALGASLGADLALTEGNADILYTHRQLEGRDLYFIINNNPDAARIAPTLRVPGPYTLYRPLTGAVIETSAPLDLELAGYEGIFVVCGA